MKKLLFFFSFLAIQQGFSQIYLPGNGLAVTGTGTSKTIHLGGLGGLCTSNTLLRGKNGANSYNFKLDTFALISNSGNRILFNAFDSLNINSNNLIKATSLGNMSLTATNFINQTGKGIFLEGTDSVRFISNKLIKAMSLGDIHIGATNSIVMVGNLWLKNYRALNSTNPGILTVDTCGRLSVAADFNLANYYKVGGNTFANDGADVFLGTKDSSGLNIGTFLNSNGYSGIAKNNIRLNPNGQISLHATPSGGNAFAFNTADNFSLLKLGSYNPYMGMFGNGVKFFTYTGGLWSTSPNNGSNLGFYNTNSTGDAYSFAGESFHQENSGQSNFFNLGTNLNVFGSNPEANLLYLHGSPSISSTSTNAKVRALFLENGVWSAMTGYNQFRSIESKDGHVALNTSNGNTLIGTNSINGKKLQVEGDASISQGLTIGDTATVPSAFLNVNTTTKGFLPPRLTTSNRNSIENPANGLIVYNIDSSWLEVYTPNGWYKLLSTSVSSGGGFQSRSANTEVNNEPAKNSFVARVGDGKTTIFTIQHNLNSDFVMVQFIDCGAEANCNLLLSIPDGARLEINGKNEVQLSFKNAPSYNRYKVMFLKIQ